ncbi:MAG TPA: class A beta-lactamase-related serine hydrolase [Leucothrix mucor]|uniref:Class A beta-lactamase-related serine hydrolase n=1 Tax=Leucothrix mucor TaxID=45248 RepID=A0A7V2WUG0_LEUMU|nr:class A beta-lactamase-related serine hydrolase [Leucothrix mucor]
MFTNKRSINNVLAHSIVFSFILFITACQSSSNTREKTIKDIRQSVKTTLKNDRAPGMAVALVNKDKIVFSEGFGVTTIGTQQMVSADTSFWLASISKTAIAVSIMHAREKGLLSLDADVYDLLERQTGVSLSKPFKEPILLKHLVSHTSSIIDNEDIYRCSFYVGEENGQHYNLANQLLGTKSCDETLPVTLIGYLTAYLSEGQPYYSEQDNFLQKKPGTDFKYSNIAAALAGYTLEAATGVSLAEYAKTHIFDPLKMSNTSWQLRDLNQDNIAIPHRWDEDTQLMTPLPLYSLSTWPDGGLRSSANDLAKYLLMVMNKGEIDNTRILKIDSVRDMLPETADLAIDEFSIGVFWAKIHLGKNGRTVIGHDGSDPGAYTYMQYDPKKQVGVVLLANGDDDMDGIDKDEWRIRHNTLIDKLLEYAEDL